MKTKLLRILIIIVLVSLSFVLPSQVLANNSALLLYPGGDDSDGLASNQSTNTIFYDRTFNFSYSDGSVCLSSQDEMCTPWAIDDAIRIFVDGKQVYYQESYTHDFGPTDFTEKLHIGSNKIRVQLIDLMGPNKGGSALWLVPTEAGKGNNLSGEQISGLSTTAGFCPGYDYSEAPGPWDGVNGTQYYYYAGGVLRQEPSITSPIIGQLADQDGFGWIMDGPLCSANTIHCGNLDRIVWYKLNVDSVVGWYTSCDPVYGYGYSSSSSGTGNETLESTEVTSSDLVPDFNEPSVDAISAQLTPEARAKWEATAAELRSRLTQEDFDKLVRLLYHSAKITECTLGVVEMVGTLSTTGVIVTTPSLADDCGDAAESIVSILHKLEPAQAPSSDEDRNPNIIQKFWNWLKSLFGN